MSIRQHRVVMGTAGAMGHCGPALGWGIDVHHGAADQHFLCAGRECWPLQVVDLQRVSGIRPARPPNRRTHAHACGRGRRQACRGGCAYVRATRFYWTSGRKVKK